MSHGSTGPAPAPGASPASGGVFGPAHRTLSLGILLSVGMVAFESLGVATVLPGVAGDLHGLDAYGWGLSALMLANIVGTVLAGRAADRGGPRRPMALGVLAFTAGCAIAGAAPTWPLFLAGRFAQGLGVGAVMAMAYTVIGLAYPERLRARMYALLSSAWTVPSLVGPAVAGVLAAAVSWRAVFLLMPPIAAVAAVLALPPLGGLRGAPAEDGAPGVPWWRRPLPAAVLLTAGTAVLLQALLLPDPLALLALAAAGLVLTVPALRWVTPRGTLTARRGLGAGVVVRALLCGVYFGSEAFLPLGLQEVRGVGAGLAGLGLSAGALTWVAGSALQARRDARGAGRVAATAAGFAVLLAGVVLIALAVLVTAVPAWVAVLGWAVGGLGMGVAFNASTTESLRHAVRQGEASAALQLAQTFATAVVAGIGGAAIAVARGHGGSLSAALLGVFALTAVLAVAGALLAPRLAPLAGGESPYSAVTKG
ncbi:MFS transporter [Bailinhaonella thermotolerans]|uniref:MFS transporter n=2 Tax=Bailinhaonella thermotolerans TaxID=1070861 RepID=A0A3A4AQP3_9ACTN|nr:MFS transporter [Bailinhaonella thermotolerans]